MARVENTSRSFSEPTVRKVTVRAVRPPPINLLDIGAGVVGVIKFQGESGLEIAERLAVHLKRLGNFQVYDPSRVQDQLNMVGIAEGFEKTQVSLRWAHENTAVDVFITGEVLEFKVTGSEIIKETFVLQGTGEEELYITEFGKLGKKERMEHRKVPLFCRTDHGSVGAAYYVWDAKSGEKIGTVNHSLSSDMPSFCYREDVPAELQVLAQERLLQRLFDRLNEEFISQITPKPMRDLYEFEVLSTSFNSSLGRRNELGILSASRGNWNQAEDVWRDLIYENPDLSAAHYNLGLVYRAMGRLTMAADELTKAFSQNPKSLYLIALEDIKHLRQQSKNRNMEQAPES